MFGTVRTMTNERGETFFVGKDVAKALGYKNVNKALADHVEEDDLTKRYPIVDNLGRRQKAILINESGLYALILSSKLKEAKAFKRWVTSEVLPQIRMTGGYIPTRDADGRELTSEEILARAEQIVGKTLRLLNAPNENCLTATEVARSWGMDVKSFNSLLERLGVQHRAQGRWQLAKQLADRGLAQVRHFFYYSLNGEQKSRSYLVWSPEGVRFLNSLYLADDTPGPKVIQLNLFINAKA
jgi:prophage antirepressor-like protein